MAFRPSDRQPQHHQPPPTYPPPFAQPQTAQPPVQIPFSDPFHTSRDPFLPGGHVRREGFGPARGWPTPQGTNLGHQQHPLSQQGQPIPPQSSNGLGPANMSFDVMRRRSLGGVGSSPQYGAPGQHEPPTPPSYPARNMPPPSPPLQMPPPPAASSHLASAPRGPPITSPFAGIRDLASFASHRSGAGMSISSILGGSDDRKPNSSPHTSTMAPSPTLHTMRSSSPGRARSASMREGLVGRREPSPIRGGIFGEPRAQSAFHDRNGAEPHRDGMFASPQYPRESPHSFRAFRPDQQEQRGPPMNGAVSMGRPMSQPVELVGPRSVEEIIAHREVPGEGRFGTFRHFGEPAAPLQRIEVTPRHETHSLPFGVISQPRDRDVFGSPQMDRDMRLGQMRFQPGVFGTPMREDQAGLFRPAVHHAPDAALQSIEARALYEMRREEPRSSPPMSDAPMYPPYARTGFIDRPMTLEEHQRIETIHRDHGRMDSDASSHRPLLGISPELNRKGRNSPLPQAVQGAQPRHIGPGGDNPGIKMEFGRMFSGLGSGVGSATPTAAQSVNGATTPSRLSPSRQYDESELMNTATSNIEDWKAGTNAAKGAKRNARQSKDEERFDVDSRATPDAQRGGKRSKTVHPAHHHHHHLHSHHHHHHPHEQEALQGSFNMLRFPSNPGPVPANAAAAHHHHHHHATHSHPAHHHHHHAPKPLPALRKPTVTVTSTKVLEEVADKPRHHLGSQLYTTELSHSSNAETLLDAKIKFVSKMKPIPLFEGKENCTYTVRVPRYYFTTSEQSARDKQTSALEEICKRGQLWGSEIYTDDSDVVAAAVHAGWLKGDFGKYNDDVSEDESEAGGQPEVATEMQLTLLAKPTKGVRPPAESPDVHITVLVLPALESYASTTSHHVLSKEWKRDHDGLSFMIHRIDFVDEGAAGRYTERGITARKQRIGIEEAQRREAAAGLLMFATGQSGGPVSVGA